MASSNMLRTGSICHVGNLNYRSESLNYIKFRSASRIKTLPFKFMEPNPCLKTTAQEKTRLHASVGAVSAGQTVLATVQVQLIKGDGEDPADVYGTIKAANTGNTDIVTLFDRSSNNSVPVRPQRMIPLMNYMVIVPKNSSIVIAADLYDYDVISSDDPIAQGAVDIPAAISGNSYRVISGTYGSIQVIITWAPNFA